MKNADIQWQQGQPFSTEFDDIYFSREGGLEETEYVFMQQNGLPERWHGIEHFVIAETGFGTGLNFLTTVHHWLQEKGEQACLQFISIEKFPLNNDDLKQALSCWPELEYIAKELIANYPPTVKGFHHIPLFDNRVVLTLIYGDVETVLPQLHAQVDAWYLDGFAPDKNPGMWVQTVFKQVARLGKAGTTFSTFTAAGIVRRGLQEVGFNVEKVKGFGKKREMLRGSLTQVNEDKRTAPWFSLPGFENKSIKNKHAVVVGAGIAGITTAYTLARRGWKVDIIERYDAVARGGSGNPLGIVMPRISLGDSAESEFYNTAFFKTLRELERLKECHPELDWQQSGVLQLASSERIKKQINNLDCVAELAQAVSAEQASELAAVQLDTSALYFAQAGWIDPVQLCGILLEDAGDRISLHKHSDVESIHYTGGTWQLLNNKQSCIMASETVILCNAGAANTFSQTGFLPLENARGQVSVIPATEHSSRLRCAICHDGYILPADAAGEHLVGASFIAGDDSTVARDEEDKDNLCQLKQHLPKLFEAEPVVTHHRAALRATTADRLPLLGPVADEVFFDAHYHDLHKGKPGFKYPAAEYHEGLYVNTGHGARGLTSAFLAAEVIGNLLNGEPLSIAESTWQALSPSRFKIRQYRKGTAG